MGSKHDITLHHLNASRSNRIFWALEELGLPYKVKVYWRLPTAMAPPELSQVTPFGKAPALTLDGGVLTESAYIVHRLLNLAAAGSDVEETPSNDSLFWAHFSEGSQMNLLQAEKTVVLTAKGYGRQAGENAGQVLDGYAKWVTDNVYQPGSQRNLDEIEKWLASKPKGTYFSGTSKPGLGDFMLFFAIHSIGLGSRKGGPYKLGPRTQEWLEMSMARPACQRAMERLKTEEEAQKAKI